LAQISSSSGSNRKPTISKLRKLEQIQELRKLIVQGVSAEAIQSRLNISRRTYQRLLKATYARDQEVMREVDQEEVILQAGILRDRWLAILADLEAISNDSSVDAEQRISAYNSRAYLAKKLSTICIEAPSFLAMQRSKKEQSSSRGWMEDQREQLRQELLAKDKGFDWHNTEFARNNNKNDSEQEEKEQEPEEQEENQDLQRRLEKQREEDETEAKKGWWTR
jgi:hypothetical protein